MEFLSIVGRTLIIRIIEFSWKRMVVISYRSVPYVLLFSCKWIFSYNDTRSFALVHWLKMCQSKCTSFIISPLFYAPLFGYNVLPSSPVVAEVKMVRRVHEPVVTSYELVKAPFQPSGCAQICFSEYQCPPRTSKREIIGTVEGRWTFIICHVHESSCPPNEPISCVVSHARAVQWNKPRTAITHRQHARLCRVDTCFSQRSEFLARCLSKGAIPVFGFRGRNRMYCISPFRVCCWIVISFSATLYIVYSAENFRANVFYVGNFSSNDLFSKVMIYCMTHADATRDKECETQSVLDTFEPTRSNFCNVVCYI